MSATIKIQGEDFDIAAEMAALAEGGADIGAVASFTGHVRAEDGLTALVLEHYPAMTAREIARHVAEAQARWPLGGVTIIHRVGRLAPGERIVLVAVAASHRGAAFEACQFLMDYLKLHAPFWKQEERGGVARWKPADADAAARWRQ